MVDSDSLVGIVSSAKYQMMQLLLIKRACHVVYDITIINDRSFKIVI